MVEWDEDKARTNLAKHKIDFADAATALYDDLALTMPDPDEPEERSVTLGMDALGRLLVVVYTWVEDEPQLISARRANRPETRRYGARRR